MSESNISEKSTNDDKEVAITSKSVNVSGELSEQIQSAEAETMLWGFWKALEDKLMGQISSI